MDIEYLQNIAGSSYVDEGLGDRIRSRGASGAQRISAMTGGSFSDLNYTKVESLFNNFIRRIAKTLKDFAEGDNSVANRLEQMRPQVTEQHLAVIQQLKDLYHSIVPTFFQQHQLKHSVLNPRGTGPQLSEMLKEGIFSRGMSLNAALQTNDPTTILNAYISDIKREYNSFLRDAIKITNAPKDYVKRVVGNLNQKWTPLLNKVEQVSGTPPVQPAPPQPQQTAQQPPSQQAAAAPVSATPPAAVPPAPQAQSPEISKNDFGGIVDRVVDIIIETVSSDLERAEKFISKPGAVPTQKGLPTDWEQPPLTKEPDVTPTNEAEIAVEKEPEDKGDEDDQKEDEPEAHGEFLYNFHSRYDKQRNFAIEVKPTNQSLNIYKLGSGNTKKLNVIWYNKRHENDIYVKHTPVQIEKQGDTTITKQTAKTEQVLLFRFWDDQVNPRNAQSKKFNVKLLLDQANPLAGDLLNGADPAVLDNLNKKTEPLLRALYATTYRKAMEFKRRLISLFFDNAGNLYQAKRTGNELVTKDQITAHINSTNVKERQRWIKSLDRIKFFDKFPDMKPKNQSNLDEIPNAMDAVNALVALGHKKIDALKGVQTAVDTIGTNATAEQYIKTAMSTKNLAPQTSTVSKPASGPVSAPVTAPVSSEKPKPDLAPSKPTEKDLGKADWDDKGMITWIKPDGKTVKLSPKQLRNMSSPRLELLLQKQGYFKKFPEAEKNKLEEEMVNPFQAANLLL